MAVVGRCNIVVLIVIVVVKIQLRSLLRSGLVHKRNAQICANINVKFLRWYCKPFLDI